MSEETQVPQTTETPPETDPVSQNQEEATKPTADLNVSDLMALKNILEVASARGAFKPAEFEAVGKSFNKLNAFLEAVANNQKES